jgi:hypothetical protein
LRSDPHGGFGERPGETDRGQPRHRAPGRLDRSRHAQLKRRLRPMRGIKTMTGLRILAAGHAFVQNLRRGHYEIAADHHRNRRLPVAFRELATAIEVLHRTTGSPSLRHDRPTQL